MNTSPFYIDIIGWTGAGLVLLAYGLISIQWITGTSYSYQALNVTGALLLVVNSYYLGAYPSVGVNAAWVGIALITVLHEWWKGPAKVINNVSAHFSKRNTLRQVTLQRIKLPALKRPNRDSLPLPGGLSRKQLS